MFINFIRRTAAVLTAAVLLTASLASAQDVKPTLKITRPQVVYKQNNRTTPNPHLDSAAAFGRIRPQAKAKIHSNMIQKRQSRIRPQGRGERVFAQGRVTASAPTIQSFGTGGGDIFEDEPNDLVAQGVSLPVNVFGEISFDFDVDFFAFQALAGQLITVEAFAARLRDSELIADIALFDNDGDLLDRSVGDEDEDPLIRYVPSRNEVLIVGIADIDDFGGSSSEYILNITRGVDVEEDEPNGNNAQVLPLLPVTIFGEIDDEDDVDFYSFVASAGQTLIVDVDAEVFGSSLDPEVNLIDAETGKELFYNDQFDGDDSRYNIVIPFTGRYVIGIGAFAGDSEGFYRLNASLVSGADAPLLTSLIGVARKTLEVRGAGFSAGAIVEVNGRRRKTTFLNSGTLRAKVKVRAGDVVTVITPPDDRRSNPLIF